MNQDNESRDGRDRGGYLGVTIKTRQTILATDATIQAAVLETLEPLDLYRLDLNGRPPVRLDVWMVRNFDGRGLAD